MKIYKIKLNGVLYEAEVESTEKAGSIQASVAAQNPAPAKVQRAGSGEEVKAPLPGSVFKLHVAQGQSVAEGDVVVVLEAMKMENEIFAPTSGVVTSLPVQEGTKVNSGDVILTIG